MKRIFSGSIFFFLLVFLLSSALAAPTSTFLVYLCGSDIPEDACFDLYEMAAAETGDNINVVILAGGSQEWELEEIKGNSRTLLTLRDGEIDTLEDWGWKSMGSEESLLEFLEYGLSAYPADRTAVILWNHGMGSEGGVCFDDTTEDLDGLTLVELDSVLHTLNVKSGGFHIDIFGCDACMMASYEMASLLSRYSIDYFVASEELEPGYGWAYSDILEAVKKDPSMDNKSLCRLIVDTYMEVGAEETPDDYLTMSAIDLQAIAPLQESLESLGLVLQQELDQGNLAQVRRGRSRMYTLGSYIDSSWDMVDMGAMLDAFAQFDPEGAATARKHLRSAVIVSRQTDNLSPCSGLSVLIPQDTKDEFESALGDFDLSLYMPSWFGFVKSYAGQLQEGSYSFSSAVPQQASGSSFFSQLSDLFSSITGYSWNDEQEDYVLSDDTSTQIAFGDEDYAFTASLSSSDLQYLDYVEGMLMMDVSDEETSGYVEIGLTQDNLVDWDTGMIYSLFDGFWPTLDGQMIPLYDQFSTLRSRRSLVPAKVNGEYTYLVVEFAPDSSTGRVIGTNAGYDENGLPIRKTTRLSEGDRIIPIFTMYLDIDEEEDWFETELEGEEIIWSSDMVVTYEDVTDESDPLDMMFAFVLNDIFGDYTMTDVLYFEM